MSPPTFVTMKKFIPCVFLETNINISFKTCKMVSFSIKAKIPFPYFFCNLIFLLENPNRSTCSLQKTFKKDKHASRQSKKLFMPNK